MPLPILILLILGLAACSDAPKVAETKARPAPQSEDPQGPVREEIFRYGLSGARIGTAVLRFYEVPFSMSARTPVAIGTPVGGDIVRSRSMILLRQTGSGIHVENEQVSVSVESASPGLALRTIISRQMSRGPSWRELLFFDNGVERISHGEEPGAGDSRQMLPNRVDGIPEEALPLVARRWAFPKLRLGQKYTLDLLAGLEWQSAIAELSAGRETIHTPAGWFRVNRFTVRNSSGQLSTWWVEADNPHRIVRWNTGAGEKGELLKDE